MCSNASEKNINQVVLLNSVKMNLDESRWSPDFLLKFVPDNSESVLIRIHLDLFQTNLRPFVLDFWIESSPYPQQLKSQRPITFSSKPFRNTFPSCSKFALLFSHMDCCIFYASKFSTSMCHLFLSFPAIPNE